MNAKKNSAVSPAMLVSLDQRRWSASDVLVMGVVLQDNHSSLLVAPVHPELEHAGPGDCVIPQADSPLGTPLVVAMRLAASLPRSAPGGKSVPIGCELSADPDGPETTDIPWNIQFAAAWSRYRERLWADLFLTIAEDRNVKGTSIGCVIEIARPVAKSLAEDLPADIPHPAAFRGAKPAAKDHRQPKHIMQVNAAIFPEASSKDTAHRLINLLKAGGQLTDRIKELLLGDACDMLEALLSLVSGKGR